MTILVTGAAGFIGSSLSQRLLARGDEVLGVDNLNDYYDVSLKEARLARLTPDPKFANHASEHGKPLLFSMAKNSLCPSVPLCLCVSVLKTNIT